MVDDNDPAPTIGWIRAILTAAVIVVVGIAILVYGTNAILTKFHNVARSNLVGIATPTFFVVLLAFAWALRQLQRRNQV
jgi:hypothetical protein